MSELRKWNVDYQRERKRREQTWAKCDVAEFTLSLWAVTAPTTMLRWCADSGSGAVTPTTGKGAQTPWRPLLPHTVHCQHRKVVKIHWNSPTPPPPHTYLSIEIDSTPE